MTVPVALGACGRQVAPNGGGLAPEVDAQESATPSVHQPRPIDDRLTRRAPLMWGTDVPGVVADVPTKPGRQTLALTFDACGGPGGGDVDRQLLDVLRAHEAPATLFLNQRWMTAHPELTADLVAEQSFRIQNHGTEHLPLSTRGRSAYGIAGTHDAEAVVEEIEGNRYFLYHEYGVRSDWFRSGTAHYDDVAVEIAHALGTRIAGFRANADLGGTAPAGVVTEQIMSAPDGAIVLAHMNQPRSGTARGVDDALDRLSQQNIRLVHLDSAAEAVGQ